MGCILSQGYQDDMMSCCIGTLKHSMCLCCTGILLRNNAITAFLSGEFKFHSERKWRIELKFYYVIISRIMRKFKSFLAAAVAALLPN